MIVIKLNARTGNQLFQFAFGHLLGEVYSYRVMYTVNQPNDLKLDFFYLGWKIELLKFSIFTRIINLIGYKVFKLKEKELTSCLDKIDVNDSLDNLILNGYFQDGIFFENHHVALNTKIKIRSKYKKQFKKELGDHFFIQRSLVVHIRRNDYKYAVFEEINSAALLPLDWFLTALDGVSKDSYEALYVVSDDLEEVKESFNWEGYNPIFVNGTEATDFQLIMNADIAIVSNSSFAWWAAFLNTKPNRRIIAPKYWVGYHVKQEYPVGIMIDQFEWKE